MTEISSEAGLVREFTKQGADYYARVFARIRSHAGFTWSFNWAAAVLGPIWATARNIPILFWLALFFETLACAQLATGFAGNLDQHAPGWATNGAAVVLGAGGASRAVIHALKVRGVTDIRIVNRTLPRARELADRFGAGVSAHGADAVGELLADAGLLINTTSLGMHGDGTLSADPGGLPDHALVTDIVYVPLETPLLAAAKARGLKTVDGLGMLLHQAAPGFERWFGRKPEVTPELRRLIVADIEGH